MNDIDKVKINLVLARFDFIRVHDTMVALSWGWKTEDNDRLLVPTIEELQTAAQQNLEIARKTGYCSSGGFTATYNQNDFRLEFIVEYASSHV